MKRINKALEKEFFQELTLQAQELYKLSQYFCINGDQNNAKYYADRWDTTLCVRDTLIEAYPTSSHPYNMVDRLILSLCKILRR